MHPWTHSGTYDVEVSAVWTVRWRVGGEAGTLTVPTVGRIEDFPVTQVQAVLNTA